MYRRRHVRCNPPGSDRIHLDVVRGKFNGHGLGQLHDGPFRRAVRRDEPRPKVRVHAANVDNLSPLLTKHRPGSDLREQEGRIEMSFDDVVPILRFFVHHAAAYGHVAGVIDQDVNGAKFLLDLVQRRLQCGALG